MASDLVLRNFRSKDAQQCSSLMQDYYRNHANSLPIEVRTSIANERTTKYVQQIATNRTIVVAVIKDEIVGMGALKGSEIRHVYVRSDYQRKRIGSKIIIILEKEANNKGISNLIVNSAFNAEVFYIKNGFIPLDETQIERHGNLLESILLKKFLK